MQNIAFLSGPGCILKAGAKVRNYFFFAKQDVQGHTTEKFVRRKSAFPNAAIGIIHNKGIPDGAGSDTFAALSGRRHLGAGRKAVLVF